MMAYTVAKLEKDKRKSKIMADDVTVITPDVLHVEQVMALAQSPSAGAVSLFVGKNVVRLEYEAYIPMASSEMRKICKLAREKWNIMKIAIYHRIGIVPIGEASVIIAVSSAHRKESLEAVSFIIDTLKATVPIWKKEIYEQGEAQWKENKECSWRSVKMSTV
ncbi:molybdopterin synthase catalytic subunit isoform X2 [Nematostella vectensis]|uniref:molybdopterin synthase catalytic subunit isoform X2 n=1 Tax=Nematostella vectensis TaxID=45351 RepID=UPI0020775CE1|nr:molybdopterin synthase catalytic subunit isoform X2 [Nematostella vectensis]